MRAILLALGDAFNELRNPLNIVLLVVVLCIMLLGQMLGQPSEHNTEMAVSADLLQAQRDAQVAMRREAAGAAYCRGLLGESLPVWDVDGRLSACQPRKGKKVIL